MYQIRKTFKFEAAHALTSAYFKDCLNLHGHSYIVEVFVEARRLNKDGMVIDFKMLKEKIKFIFDNWDHSLIISDTDSRWDNSICSTNECFPLGLLKVPFNPTAENMAKHLFDECSKMLYGTTERDVKISKMRVHETVSGWAEYFK